LPLKKRIDVAVIYGSIAGEEETAKSDVDLLVIGTISFDSLSEAIDKVEKRTMREINPSLYPTEEFKEKIRRKNHFLRSVLKSNLIYLIGSENDLARLAKE
jgi:predicted nucleotidyltransferase